MTISLFVFILIYFGIALGYYSEYLIHKRSLAKINEDNLRELNKLLETHRGKNERTSK